MNTNEDTKETVRYLLGRGDEDEATKVLKASNLSDEEAQSVINEAEPMTTKESIEHINSN